MPFGGGSCRVETGPLSCIAGQLTGSCMIRSFAKGNFRTDMCSEMPFVGGSCHFETGRMAYVVNWLTSFCMVLVFTESFFRTDFLIV